MNSTLLGMFARYWLPGQVKTRLAASIGDAKAAAIQRLFVDTLATRLAGMADHRILSCTPADRCRDVQMLVGNEWLVQPQAAGDLGARIQAFFQAALRQAKRVVLIGSDSPDLPCHYLDRAFEALNRDDVVLGPSADGGYYLIGVAHQVPPLFDQIAWGTPRVWEQTVAGIRAAKISWHELPLWYDVDDEPALQHLLMNLRGAGRSDPRLALLHESLTALLTGSASE